MFFLGEFEHNFIIIKVIHHKFLTLLRFGHVFCKMFGTPLITVMTSRKAVWSVNLHFVLGRTHHQGDTVSSGPHFDHLNFKKSLRKQRVLFVVWSLYSFVGVKMGYEFWVFASLRSSWSFGNYSWIRYSGRLSCTQLLLCVCRWYRHESLHKGAKLRAVVNLCNYDVTWANTICWLQFFLISM